VKLIRTLAGFKTAGTVLFSGLAPMRRHIRVSTRDMRMRRFGTIQTTGPTFATVGHRTAERKADAYKKYKAEADRFPYV